jgi:FAD:protein FMN transferase
MGTTYTVKIVSPPAGVTGYSVRSLIEQELARIDRAMSGYREDSEISRFNASQSTDWFEVSAELAQVVAGALHVSEQSNGAFDVTVAPLVRLWGFGSSDKPPATLPDDATIAELRSAVGYHKIHARVSPAALKKDATFISVDLNGIAPGFAVDQIAARFDALAIVNYMIDIGGEIRVRGVNAQGELWRIAVENPADTQALPMAVLGLKDISVATSGEYRHYYDRDGKRYSHTIDPRTGRPVSHALAAVVVVHPESMYADAFATAYNVLGPEAGFELAQRLGMPVMLIVGTEGGLVTRTTEGMRKFVVQGGDQPRVKQ